MSTTTVAKKTAKTAVLNLKKGKSDVQTTLGIKEGRASEINEDVCENAEGAAVALVYIAKTYTDPKEFAWATYCLGKYVGQGMIDESFTPGEDE